MDQVDEYLEAFVAAHHREPIDTGELVGWLRAQNFERAHGRPPRDDAELMVWVRQRERSLLAAENDNPCSFLH